MFRAERKGGYIAIENDDACALSAACTDFEEIDNDAVGYETTSSAFPPVTHQAATVIRPSDALLDEHSRRWDHIENLDEFFTRIYEYHQQNGYACICAEFIFCILRYLFSMLFATFVTQCVDYEVLFNIKTNITQFGGKRALSDVIVQDCTSNLHPFVIFLDFLALCFVILTIARAVFQIIQFHETSHFYSSVLGISDNELRNYKWQDIVKKLCAVQPKLHLIINKEQITSLDVYQRILRHKNYFVALVNQEILPPFIHLPFFGERPYFSTGLKRNLEWLLFWGYWSPWNGSYCLKDEFMNADMLFKMTLKLESTIFYTAIFNLLLSPFILIYQILYSFFTYVSLVKREPSALGLHRYSNFAKTKLRHFNELDHELRLRLSRGYRNSVQYMDQFDSPFVAIVAKNIAYVAGAVFGVLFILSAYDEDVLTVEHVITLMTVGGVILLICRSFITDENMIWHPESLMNLIIAQIHYAPNHWKGQAHKDIVRREFGHLFQLKAEYVIEELLSPILTPFILIYCIKPKVRDIVHFFHDCTISIDGLGDVCSFALMDINRHGDPQWNSSVVNEDQDFANQSHKNHKVLSNNGKTELSLLNFAINNPRWVPPQRSARFLGDFRAMMERDARNILSESRKNLLLEASDSLLQRENHYHQNFAISASTLHQIISHDQDSQSFQNFVPNPGLTNYGLLNVRDAEMPISVMYLRNMVAENNARNIPTNYGAIERSDDGDESQSFLSNIWNVPAQSMIATEFHQTDRIQVHLGNEAASNMSENIETRTPNSLPNL